MRVSLDLRARPLNIKLAKENAMATRNEKMKSPKDAIAMLKADHRKVRQLFRDYQAAKDQTLQWEIALQVFDELEVHAQLEEVVFYQAVEEETTSLGKRLVQASLEEHQEALVLIHDLRGLVPGCPEVDNKFQALVLTVEYHMNEEETEMFPLAEAELEEDLKDLRDEMLEIKGQLLPS
jgi:hemerythrin-like domain-containing protein